MALTYLRRNRAQAESGETFGVSQPTISRAISGVTPLLGKALSGYVPTADELDGRAQYIVD
ncbi:MAG: transposase family protein, partial [Pseudonocardiales bacterium]|nr:transposase family protein [Pseudonocardiales bacterium]